MQPTAIDVQTNVPLTNIYRNIKLYRFNMGAYLNQNPKGLTYQFLKLQGVNYNLLN